MQNTTRLTRRRALQAGAAVAAAALVPTVPGNFSALNSSVPALATEPAAAAVPSLPAVAHAAETGPKAEIAAAVRRLLAAYDGLEPHDQKFVRDMIVNTCDFATLDGEFANYREAAS